MQVQEEALMVLDGVLLPNLDLLFNQHLSNLVACCIYGAARCSPFSIIPAYRLGIG